MIGTLGLGYTMDFGFSHNIRISGGTLDISCFFECHNWRAIYDEDVKDKGLMVVEF